MFCKLLFTLSRFDLLSSFSADEELCSCFCAIGPGVRSSDAVPGKGHLLRGSVGGIAKPVPSATWVFLSHCCYCENAVTGLCVCLYSVPISNI